MQTKTMGNNGEDYAAARLQSEGWTVLERGYRCSYGEIDIIAKRSDVIAFIEVKTRAANFKYRPAQSVTYPKQLRIMGTAEHYIEGKAFGMSTELRLDIIEIIAKSGKDFEVLEYNHIENAFIDTR